MSAKQYKNEFLLSEKIQLSYMRIKQFCETGKFLIGQLQSPLVLESNMVDGALNQAQCSLVYVIA